LTVAAGALSPILPFEELAGSGTGDLRMYLQVTKLGQDCSPPPDEAPGIGLSAGGGPMTQIMTFPDFSPIHNAQDDHVADASLSDQGDGVYRVQIFITDRSATWQLVITNFDDTQRRFTWVVADNKADAAQPWLNLPPTLSFTAEPGEAVTKAVDVPNLGSAKLTIAQGGLPGTSRFQVTVPPDIAPNRCGKLTIRFSAPTAPGTTEEDYTAQTNDQLAAPSTQHNNRIHLTATTKQESGPDPEPLDGMPCHVCSCPNFAGSPTGPFNQKCGNRNCRHSRHSHLPI
jgi:hypothetical protein